MRLKMLDVQAETRVRVLMEVLNIPSNAWDDVISGGSLGCDKCEKAFLAYFAHDLDHAVLCDECYLEEQDPIIAMSEALEEALLNNPDSVVEVNDHYMDEDGVTRSRPMLVLPKEDNAGNDRALEEA